MKKSIKQSTMVLILNTASIILIALSITAFFIIVRSNGRVDRANSDRYDLIEGARRFMDGSAYLTNEVRAYAVTGDKSHYGHYWNEVNVLKNRDAGVERMWEIGITEDENLLVEKMFFLSNNLIPLEEEAMHHAAQGDTHAAVAIVYGQAYEDWIAEIRSTQTDFIEMLNRRTESHLQAQLLTKRTWTIITIICLSVTALIQAVSAVAVHRKVILPLVAVRDEMLRIEKGNLRTAFDAVPDTSEMGMLIGAIHSTKSELNKYITDISDKLAALAGGDLSARVEIDYIGNFVEIKRAINTIAQQLADQRQRDMRSREELQEAYDNANAANRAKSFFLSNMSHEIRTPMNAIIGMTDIALASGDPDKKNYCLGKINDASTHLLGIINDILDMSKIDANKLELSPVAFSFERMLIRAVNVINIRVDEKRQNLHVRIDREIPGRLVADEQRLSQVVINLLSNAVKFTPDCGSIQLEASLETEVHGQCTVLVSVKDSGIGLSAEQQKKLFKPFAQADESVSRRFGGTGLGLMIAKSIVEKMGGSIWLESREGEGATFWFTFRAEIDNGASESDGFPQSRAWEALRILVVDADPSVQEDFQSLAEELSFCCDVAADEAQARRLLEDSGGYDLLFIAHRLQLMDGIELTRRIRAQGVRTTVVLMLSAVEWASVEEEAKQAGADLFVSRPLFPSVILETIAGCMGAGKGVSDAPEREELPDFGGHTILLAEDIEVNREIVITLLQPTGVAVVCAETGMQAVKLMEEQGGDFDMIFMDMHMPEMGGDEATVRIRQMSDPHAKSIPIVAMTANVFREDIEQCLAIGMDDHIGKPLDFEQMLEVMRKYIKV